MKESTLWKHLKPELKALGKFQKLSDRFTPGVPDVLGCFESVGVALELKQVKGVRVLKVEFRPGQLDWLEDWDRAGGRSWIVSSKGQTVYVHPYVYGDLMESGVGEEEWEEGASLVFTKSRKTSWKEFCVELLKLEGTWES